MRAASAFSYLAEQGCAISFIDRTIAALALIHRSERTACDAFLPDADITVNDVTSLSR